MNIKPVKDEEAIDSLAEISELFEFVAGSVDEILETSPELFQVRESANNIFNQSQSMLSQTSALTERHEDRIAALAGVVSHHRVQVQHDTGTAAGLRGQYGVQRAQVDVPASR